eukprot:15458792-Alexandrium_andersonii.AAC.1
MVLSELSTVATTTAAAMPEQLKRVGRTALCGPLNGPHLSHCAVLAQADAPHGFTEVSRIPLPHCR